VEIHIKQAIVLSRMATPAQGNRGAGCFLQVAESEGGTYKLFGSEVDLSKVPISWPVEITATVRGVQFKTGGSGLLVLSATFRALSVAEVAAIAGVPESGLLGKDGGSEAGGAGVLKGEGEVLGTRRVKQGG
jgi:hypothetical protein